MFGNFYKNRSYLFPVATVMATIVIIGGYQAKSCPKLGPPNGGNHGIRNINTYTDDTQSLTRMVIYITVSFLSCLTNCCRQ